MTAPAASAAAGLRQRAGLPVLTWPAFDPLPVVGSLAYVAGQYPTSQWLGPYLPDVIGALVCFGALLLLLKYWKPRETLGYGGVPVSTDAVLAGAVAGGAGSVGTLAAGGGPAGGGSVGGAAGGGPAGAGSGRTGPAGGAPGNGGPTVGVPANGPRNPAGRCARQFPGWSRSASWS